MPKFSIHPGSRFGPPPQACPPGLFLQRIIGTRDINDKGTLHAVERQCDPFVFLDEATVLKNTPLPFGKHPHTGIVAMSEDYTASAPQGLWR
jgi:hypothetical protein